MATTNTSPVPVSTSHFRISGGMAQALVCVFACLGAWLKWGKLYSLLYVDPAWWLNEFGRYARGELPYRDFYWPYGPLSADVFAWPMRWFGPRFTVVQLVIDFLSLIVIVLVYRIARRLLPSPLCEFTTICFIAVGITVHTYFSLFSIISYTPAVHTAAIGLLILILNVLKYIEDEHQRTLWLAAGTWCACLSKQEALLAAIALFVVLAIFDRRLHFRDRTTAAWLRSYAILGVCSFGVPALVYLWWARIASWERLLACLQGFGLATMACPWWPTGFGTVGSLVELGEAWVLFTVGSFFIPSVRERFAGKYWLVCLIALVAIIGSIAWKWQLYDDLFNGPGSLMNRVSRDGAELLSTSAVLRPVLLCGYVYIAVILFSAVRNSFTLTKSQLADLVLVMVPAVMGLRNVFGSMLAPDLLEVPAVAYPFLLITGPWLLFRALTFRPRGSSPQPESADRRAVLACAAALLFYAAVRIVGGYPDLFSSHTYLAVDTPAGRIRLASYASEKPILDYVLARTTPSDSILEMPFGGGMSFATGRQQPTYSTLFAQIRPSMAIQNQDLERMMKHPPQVVIAKKGPHLGTLYGYPGMAGCTFPRLVWQPDQPLSDPAYVFPFVAYLEQNYRVDREIGEWVLLRPIVHSVADSHE